MITASPVVHLTMGLNNDDNLYGGQLVLLRSEEKHDSNAGQTQNQQQEVAKSESIVSEDNDDNLKEHVDALPCRAVSKADVNVLVCVVRKLQPWIVRPEVIIAVILFTCTLCVLHTVYPAREMMLAPLTNQASRRRH